jgi:trans-L-3-hydroxyproline dehydratase
MNWTPPKDWLRITTIDAHAGGEPLRIITGGLPPIPGDSILARRRYLRENMDYLRTTLMWEPRGHADMYGAIMTAPITSEADVGVLFLHNEGYSTMCGHGIIALVTVALETGMLPVAGTVTTVKLDTPAGLVTARAKIEDGRVRSVAFENVPSFVYALDQRVDVPGIGRVGYDVAFGGAFYAYCQAIDLGVDLRPSDFRRLIEVGTATKQAVMDSLPIRHPFEEDLSFLYGTIIVGSPQGEGADSRNVCIFAEGEVDRCPTGTGVSGRLALNYARGQLVEGQPFVVESIIDTRFVGRILGTGTFGEYEAVTPEIEGSAHIVGRHEFLIDPDDPLRDGFILR